MVGFACKHSLLERPCGRHANAWQRKLGAFALSNQPFAVFEGWVPKNRKYSLAMDLYASGNVAHAHERAREDVPGGRVLEVTADVALEIQKRITKLVLTPNARERNPHTDVMLIDLMEWTHPG